MIQHVCPHCSETVSFSSDLGGFTVKCPECRVPLDVPAASRDTDDRHSSNVPTWADYGKTPDWEMTGAEAPSSRPGRWRKWVILTGIPVVAGLVAWLLGGNGVWYGVAVLGGVALAFVAWTLIPPGSRPSGAARPTTDRCWGCSTPGLSWASGSSSA
jgi:hypothetical protein